METPLKSVNQSAPSEPAAIQVGLIEPVENSVMLPPVVMRPSLWLDCSVNHRALSGPTMIPIGPPPAVVTVYRVMTPEVVLLRSCSPHTRRTTSYCQGQLRSRRPAFPEGIW